MYSVVPKGINIKDNDRNVTDGFLQESINLQWKDGSLKPIPERLTLFSNISAQEELIFHKVSDEDTINVLMISTNGILRWFGKIQDGIYTSFSVPISILDMPRITDFEALSFTILNGLIYFMSKSQEFYYRLQYNESTNAYEVKDMYAWKSLIPYYPEAGTYTETLPKGSYTTILCTLCGIVLYRFTLVLKTGDEVLHSPIYVSNLYSINVDTSAITKDSALTNIHTIINTNLDYLNTSLLTEEISAINIYASIPNYVTKVNKTTLAAINNETLYSQNDKKGEIQRLAEQPFYLIKTIEEPSSTVLDEAILLYEGVIDNNLNLGLNSESKINMDTIAAGEIMPIDNFTYHEIYGKITSYNGRLIISNPKTILSNGHVRSLSLSKTSSKNGYSIETEDGTLKAFGYSIDTKLTEITAGSTYVYSRGLISYPDSRTTIIGIETVTNDPQRLYKLRANKAHNLACAFNFNNTQNFAPHSYVDGTNFKIEIRPSSYFIYGEGYDTEVSNPSIQSLSYDSNNRIQFSEAGEFSVWPAVNSYRIKEGKIVFVGSNSIDPANSDYLAPLILGTSDGVYTVNFDPTGNQLIQSITKTANLPAISDKNIQIDQNLIYVSDKGLIVINNGTVINITNDLFPEYGNGDFPLGEIVYPNYNILTNYFFNGPNPYNITDIIDYMKGSLFAYDARRHNIWCSNPNKNFSLIYSLETKQWTFSTYVFKKVCDYNAIVNIAGDEIYSRYLVKSNSNQLDILSGENLTRQVKVHLLTRPIKMQYPEQYKKIQRLMSRCELYRSGSSGKFTFGLWGKQDLNKDKVSVPLIAIDDNTSSSFPNNIRQNIPIGNMMGKFKTFTILQGGFIHPKSSIDGFEIEAIPVENNKLR